MNPAAEFQFIHAISSVERLPEVEKAILEVSSPGCLLMVTPRDDGHFSVIVGVPASEDREVILQTLETLAGQVRVIGSPDTSRLQTYREGSSEPTLDF